MLPFFKKEGIFFFTFGFLFERFGDFLQCTLRHNRDTVPLGLIFRDGVPY
jgi:hypothetical protein